MSVCISLSALRYRWPNASEPSLAIDQLDIQQGERVFLHGPSGSGKSTLLNLIAGVLRPEAGEIEFLGQAFSTLKSAKRDRLRADHIGYIFQQFNLLPYLSVLDNVLLPCQVSRLRQTRAKQDQQSLNDKALSLLEGLGLSPELSQRAVTELSIGQQQRVAAARALMGSPELIIADEPTSALDTVHRQRFIEQLLTQCEQHHSSLLFVSHDDALKPAFSRQLDLTTLNQARPLCSG